MVKASLAPFADNQQFAIVWLENYFQKYADSAPNKDEIHLLIMQKKDLYERYRAEYLACNRSEELVSYPRFIELWNVIFPKAVTRPWCSIPGKCNVCGEIDRLRRVSQDNYVQQCLRDAHHLHRGGMFMLERQE
jgi:hypothetical protein